MDSVFSILLKGLQVTRANSTWLQERYTHQSIAGLISEKWTAIHTHIRTYGQLTNQPVDLTLRLWEETRAPEGNPHRHGENIQTPQKKTSRVEPRSSLLWCNSAKNTIMLKKYFILKAFLSDTFMCKVWLTEYHRKLLSLVGNLIMELYIHFFGQFVI